MDEPKSSKAKSFAKRIALRKVAKAIPIVGGVVSLFFIAQKIEEKGVKRGAADAALDATPFIGRAKAVYELFADDIVPPPKPA